MKSDRPNPVAHVAPLVDRILLEHGNYQPVELLLSLGYLDHGHYIEWRRGQRGALDQWVSLEPGEIVRVLEVAASWAEALGLEAERQAFRSRGGDVPLTASTNRRLDELLTTRFYRPADQVQLDLFKDGAVVRARNRLLEMLLVGDAAAAAHERDRLLSLHGHGPLDDVQALIEALEYPTPESIDEGLESLRKIEEIWQPAASGLLGRHSRDFLLPFWRAAGRALEPLPFDADNSNQHASYAYFIGFAWEDVRRVVRSVDFERQPILLERLAEAEWRLRNRPAAVSLWLQWCRLAPDTFTDAIQGRIMDRSMRMAWNSFPELDTDLSSVWFPAWMLLEEPGLTRVLPECDPTSDAEAGFNVVRALLAGRQDDIELRRQLQQLSPALLARFLGSLQ